MHIRSACFVLLLLAAPGDAHRVAAQQIHGRVFELRPVEVRGESAARSAARLSATRLDLFAGAVLAEVETRGGSVVEVVRTLPGVAVLEGVFTTRYGRARGVCMTSIRRIASFSTSAGTPDAPWCEPLPLIVDDVAVGEPIEFLRTLRVAEYESIQLVSAAEAHIRYGLTAGAAGGALVLWTRGRGPHVSQSRNIPRR